MRWRRQLLRKIRRQPRWQLVIALSLAAVPLIALNLAVAMLGSTRVFPLSPFHLRDKLAALGAYAVHRPRCLVIGHPPLEEIIARAERKHRLPPHLLASLIQIESNTRVHRISPTGAMGPGQLMPHTARLLGVRDPFDPEESIDGSARYLAIQLRHFHSRRLALAAYNAGPGSVSWNGGVPQNGETEFYVSNVLRAWRHAHPLPAR